MKANTPKTIRFTKEAYEKLRNDLVDLEKYREEVLVRLQEAREKGDLSENGAYTAAKFELGETDRKLRRIKHQLRYGEVVESKHNGVVDFGSKVTLEREGKQMMFTLVSGYESDPKEQKLSETSPIGRAVKGKKKGDEVVVEAPAGEVVYRVVGVE